MGNFKTGDFFITNGINAAYKTAPGLQNEIIEHLQSYCAGEWGKLPEEDKQANDNAITSGNGRILARYGTSAGDIYIITEADRSATIVLFCNEY